MTRSWVQVHRLVAIVLLALVLVHNPQANWCAQCDAKLGARLDFYSVFLVARSRDCRLAWSSTSHLRLDVVFSEGHARWAAVDDGADRKAMGLAIAVDCQNASIECSEVMTYVVTLKCVPKVDMIVVA